MRREAILAGLMASCCVLPTQVWAQVDEAQDDERQVVVEEGVPTIVVTAQRRAEDLQSVPIAITAVSAEELQNRTVRSISDLQSMTPNVHFDSGTQGTGVITIGIRGIKQSSTELSNEQAVATYVDGVYQGTPLGSAILLGPDLQSIEVLRGPQGTLFGRNTVAGAVLINTHQPEDFFEGRGMMGIGSHGLMELQGMLNLPLGDMAAFRVNYSRTTNDGYATDATTGTDLGDTNLNFVRAQLKLTPSDNFEVIARGQYFHNRSGGNLLQPIFIRSGGLTERVVAITLGLTPGAPGTSQAVANFYLTCGRGVAAPDTTIAPHLNDRCFDTSNPIRSTYEEWAGSVTASLDITPNIQLKSITGYTDFEQFQPQDYDGSLTQILWNGASPYGHVFTQEVQLNGSLFSDRLQFASGVFYYRQWNNDLAFNQVLSPLAGPNSRGTLISFHLDKSLGVYSQGTFSIADNFRVTAGARYTDESKVADTTQFTSRAAPVLQACTLPVPNPECVAHTENDFNSFDYTLGADFDVADDVLVYARVATGFLAGGINQRSTTGVPFITYDPQESTNYELGLKSELFDRAVRLNLAVFQTDITNLQKSVPRTFLNTGGLPVTVVAQINAASARVRGIEVEAAVEPFENFGFNFNLGYLDQEYKRFLVDGPAGPQTLDLSQTNFIQSPEWTIGVSPRYTIPLSFGELLMQADYYWQSDNDLAPPTSAPLVIPGRDTVQDSFGLLNARVALIIRDNTEIAVWGKNLTDERYFNSILDLAGSLGFMNGKVGDPRTWGIQLSRRF